MACTPPFCLGTGGWCGCNCGCCPPCPAYKYIEYKWVCGSGPLEIVDPCATQAFRKADNGIQQAVKKDENTIQAQAFATVVICDLVVFMDPSKAQEALEGATDIPSPDQPIVAASTTITPAELSIVPAQSPISPQIEVAKIPLPNGSISIKRDSNKSTKKTKIVREEPQLQAQIGAGDPCVPFYPPVSTSIGLSYSGCGLVGSGYNFIAVGSGTLFISLTPTQCGNLVGLANGQSSSIELQDCDSVVISFTGTFTDPCCFCCASQIIYTLADHCGGGTVDPCNPTFRITNSKTGKVVKTSRYALLNKVKKTLRYTKPNP